MRAVFTILTITILLMTACSANRRLNRQAHRFEEIPEIVVPGDILHLKLLYYPDFSQTVIVQPDGHIDAQGIGRVQVKGLTLSQVRETLDKRFSAILALPELEVELQQSLDLSFYIGGAINRPGKIQFRKNINIRQGIALAGGLKDKNRRHEIVVFRKSVDKGVQMYKLKMRSEGSQFDEFKLQPLDVVFVMTAMPAKKREFDI